MSYSSSSDFQQNTRYTSPNKPKIFQRLLRPGTVRDKVQSDSFGGSVDECSYIPLPPRHKRGKSPSPLRFNRRGSKSAAESRNGSSSALSSSSSTSSRENSTPNRWTLSTGRMSPSPRTKKKNKLPPNNTPTCSPSTRQVLYKTSSSSVGLSSSFSGLSITSAERNRKGAIVYKQRVISSDSLDATSLTSRNSLKRGLKKQTSNNKRETNSLMKRFSVSPGSDRKRAPFHLQSRSTSAPPPERVSCPSDELYTDFLKDDEEESKKHRSTVSTLPSSPPRSLFIDSNNDAPQSATSQKIRSTVSTLPSTPPRSLFINNDNIAPQSVTSPLSTEGQGCQHFDVRNDDALVRDESSKNSEQNKKVGTLTFREDATAREVLEVIAAQKKESQKKKRKDVTLKPSETSKTSSIPEQSGSYDAMALALDLVGGLGAAVQNCSQCVCAEGDDSLFHGSSNGLSIFTRNASIMTLDTYEKEQLLEDIERFERLNSFETHGTMNTMATNSTNDTGYSSALTGAKSLEEDDSMILLGNVQDIPIISEEAASVIEKKKNKKRRKKKRKKRKKAVGFEYPPISRLKEVPRINSEERKKLFFTEDELDQYESDRRHNVSDDVEVVAVEGSESEEEECDSETTNGEEEDSIEKWIKCVKNNGESGGPALRSGKYSKPFHGRGAGGSINGNGNNSIDGRSSSTPRLTNKKADGVNTGNQHRKSSRNNDVDNGNNTSKPKKLKGVQIYLRQRSKAKK